MRRLGKQVLLLFSGLRCLCCFGRRSVAICCASTLYVASGCRLGKQILSLFAVLPLSLLLLGAGWTADAVAICCASAFFVASGRRLGKQILSLFAMIPLSLLVLGAGLECKFSH